MRLSKTLFLSFCALSVIGASPASAEPKPWKFSWWAGHWENLTWQPYIDHPTQPQNVQWADKSWTPADWTGQRRDGAPQVIQDFYRADILHKQYVEDHVPVLEVGPNFYALSGYDKRRVMQVVDDYYKITSNHENAMFTLTDSRTKQPIGLYTAHGLQLQ